MATSFEGVGRAAMTFTLPREYRPRYVDRLLQSSSEQRPLQLNVAASSFEHPIYPVQAARTLESWVPAWRRKRIPISMLCNSPPEPSSIFAPQSLPKTWEVEAFPSMGPAQADPSFTRPLPPGLNIGFGKLPRLLHSPASYMDFFMPHVTSVGPASSLSDDSAHSEIYTVWRGLTVSGARELFQWSYAYEDLCWKWEDLCTGPVTLSSIASELVYQGARLNSPDAQALLQANLHRTVERFLFMSTSNPSLQLLEPQLPTVGQLYVLTPHVSTVPGFSAVCWSSADWFKYDPSQHRFQGIVPASCPRHISITVRITHVLDKDRRIEHTIRTRAYLRLSATATLESISCVFYKPAKRVSFADDSDSESHSSFDSHLKPFFDSLAAMTCVPDYAPPVGEECAPSSLCRDEEESREDGTDASRNRTSDAPPSYEEVVLDSQPDSDADLELGPTNPLINMRGPITIFPDLTVQAADAETVRILNKYSWKGWENEAAKKKKARVLDESSNDSSSDGSDDHQREDLEKEADNGGTFSGRFAKGALTNSPSATKTSDAVDGPAETGKIPPAAAKASGSSETLFDTVRNQFLKEHRDRQTYARINRLKSKRMSVQQLFSANDKNYDSVKQVEFDRGLAEALSEHMSWSDGDADSEMSEESMQLSEDSKLESMLEESMAGSEAEAIAEAVKRSFDAEVQEEDPRNARDIRKGMLMHEVLALEEAKRRRLYGSSNYEDLFQAASGSGSGSGSQAQSSSNWSEV